MSEHSRPFKEREELENNDNDESDNGGEAERDSEVYSPHLPFRSEVRGVTMVVQRRTITSTSSAGDWNWRVETDQTRMVVVFRDTFGEVLGQRTIVSWQQSRRWDVGKWVEETWQAGPANELFRITSYIRGSVFLTLRTYKPWDPSDTSDSTSTSDDVTELVERPSQDDSPQPSRDQAECHAPTSTGDNWNVARSGDHTNNGDAGGEKDTDEAEVGPHFPEV
ncbi:hypothetical protein M231_05877 [Tremella mesenterica]|uniref:Uncharacterized protein n=1 Tax=Tremella mesenterica TaxID=5217 RepID=A0A4V1M3H1_TREME|nr:uncharacterized protein TREMEDRAFT_65120 [Tremella mesenterica DSM 1558]EIW66726.1 hypothetical protein TREMEDRAFT_65120 [Tremella mesenterica DSM 1558]RXK36847.1 hypothetical protein M231_05877 [Tremella mesenterica]